MKDVRTRFLLVSDFHGQLDLVDDLAVHTQSDAVTTVTLGRGRAQHGYRIDVAVQKKFKKGNAAELDPLMALLAEIADHFRFKRLDG